MTGARTRVLAAGTFDGFHEGHRDFLRQAKSHGDELVVIIARDATVERIKGRRPQRNENERAATVAAEPLVHQVVLGRTGGDRYALLAELRPQVVFLGYDQPASEQEIQERLREEGLNETKVLRGDPFHPEIYKSSLLNRT